jgi:hypothetical protein
MKALNTTAIDFFSIKNNFITFLRNQSEFSGFDFEGSSLNVLLDVLSYNTYYQSVYNNMVANEMFLDSALLRKSVVSKSKELNYFPKSVRSSRAKLKVISEEKGTLPRNSIFKAIGFNNNNYSFHTNENYELLPNTFDEDGSVLDYSSIIDVYEGILTTYTFIIEDPEQILELPFTGIDEESLKIIVLDAPNQLQGSDVIWSRSKDINELTPDSTVFFLEENSKTTYNLYFGDGILGKKLERGNVIICEFRISNGSFANNIGSIGIENTFVLSGYTVQTLEPSYGGSEVESGLSIKRNAPKKYTTANRAVTTKDYEALIVEKYPYVAAIRCWGGEDANPPQYGKIFVSLKPTFGTSLSKEEKQSIVASISQPQGIVGTSIEFIDPDLLFINFSIDAKIQKGSRFSISQISRDIRRRINLYSFANLQEFNDTFFNSNLVTNLINNIPLDSVVVDAKLEKRISPKLFNKQNITIDFNNEIYNPILNNPISSITSSVFKAVVNGTEYNCYLEENGNGKVILYTINSFNTKTILSEVGDIDYTAGIINLQNFAITGYTPNFDHIKIYAKLKNKDITTNRNTILSFDTTSSDFIALNLSYNTGAEGLNNYSNPLTRR